MALFRLALLLPLFLVLQPLHSQASDEPEKKAEKEPEKKDAPETKTGEPAPKTEATIRNPLITIPAVLVFLFGALLMGLGSIWEKVCEFIGIFGAKAKPERGKSIALIGAVLILLSGAAIYFLG